MLYSGVNSIHLYLPLLNSPHPEVQQQACALLLGTHGDRALVLMQQLLDHPDSQVRYEAHHALQIVANRTGRSVSMRPLSDLYIECLGGLRVFVRDRLLQPADWTQANGGRAGGHKVRAVFAYLVHCGACGTTREELASAVWGRGDSMGSLSRTLTTLQQILAQAGGRALVNRALVLTRERCVLEPISYQTDVRLLEHVFNIASYTEQQHGLQEAIPLYEQVLALYNGPYFADIICESNWQQQRSDLLRNDLVIATERLAEYAYMRRRYQQCIDLCQQAIEADERADDLYVWLLRAAAKLDRQSLLEHAYMRYLSAATIDPVSEDGQQDLVVQTYHTLETDRSG